jgi:hypothetical protein
MAALYSRMSIAKANHCFASMATHLLLVIYFFSPSPCSNINLTLSSPREQEAVKKVHHVISAS